MKNKLWVEKYRPNTVADYVFVDERQKKQVVGWVSEGSIPHLLLSGDPGTGKTTLAKVLMLVERTALITCVRKLMALFKQCLSVSLKLYYLTKLIT